MGASFSVSSLAQANLEALEVSWPDGQLKWTCGETAQTVVAMQAQPPEDPGHGKGAKETWLGVALGIQGPQADTLHRAGTVDSPPCPMAHAGPFGSLPSVSLCGSWLLQDSPACPQAAVLRVAGPCHHDQGLGLGFEQPG